MSQKDTGLPGGPTEQATIGTLVGRLSEQISRLVRAEIASAKTELTTKAKGIGIGAGLIAAGLVFALYALGVLLYAAVAGIANALPLWLSALIVGVALLLVTGILVGVGAKLLKKGTPPKPEITVNSIKDDVAAIKEGLKS
jgi:high-affinity Fe2+/Pb2+ permease